MLSVLTKLLYSTLVHLLWSLGPLGESPDVAPHTAVRKRGIQVRVVRAVGGPGGKLSMRAIWCHLGGVCRVGQERDRVGHRVKKV